MKMLVVAAALLAAVPVTPAAAMDVAAYLAKAEILRQQGMMAMFSGEYKQLQAETLADARALKQERLAAQRAGRRPAYCPADKASLVPEEIFAAMNAVPPARRAQTPVKDALRAAFARKYPCGGAARGR
ncbi:MAG TPA: hypothetical protein VGD66_15630 [Allosphingosinicella sp.]|jgi:hypothetical protein